MERLVGPKAFDWIDRLEQRLEQGIAQRAGRCGADMLHLAEVIGRGVEQIAPVRFHDQQLPGHRQRALLILLALTIARRLRVITVIGRIPVDFEIDSFSSGHAERRAPPAAR